ncbi:unnamed protein product [Cuscuta europaea]|uniref:Uncharacterized protein n=1 Tax=Cuscuta europaea TaxID=41803 RepID=A0A9P0ZU66_CUSEU|nr:unnamed protein product [Cuscuta europaea]
MFFSSGSSEEEDMPLICRPRGKGLSVDKFGGSSSQVPDTANLKTNLPEQPVPDDGCLSGDDVATYNKGMPEQPPCIPLHFLRCHELGIAPSVDLFLHHYCYQSYWTTGYLKLVARSDRQVFTENPTPPADWEERFLFVRVGTPLPFPDRWNAYPVRDSETRPDEILLLQSKSLCLGGSRNLRSFITPSNLLTAGIGKIGFVSTRSFSILNYYDFISFFAGVIPSTAVRRSTPTSTSPTSMVKGKEKITVWALNDADQARKKRRGNDGGQLIPVDHVVDLTGPEVEPKRYVLPPKPKTPVLADMSVNDRMFIEFSNMGPRAERRYLFGQMPSSMWCSTALKVPPSFSNLTHWSDLIEAVHQEALKVHFVLIHASLFLIFSSRLTLFATCLQAGVYYHRAFLAAEQEMKLLTSDREDGQVLLSAARKLAADLQDRVTEGEKAKAALAAMEERTRRRDREIKEPRCGRLNLLG